MLSIGLVGVNTYHAEMFTRIFNGDADNAPRLTSGRITHVCSNGRPERLAELEKMLGSYDNVVENFTDMIGKIDAVLVVDDTDGGGKHAEYARPFIEAGIPTYVDKPMTTVYQDAVDLFDLAEKHGTLLQSASSLRFPVELDRERLASLGTLSSIISVGPEEWFYYGVHAVELLCAVTDDQPVSVMRFANDKKDVAVIEYETPLIAVVETLRDAGYLFHITIYGENGRYDFSVDDYAGFYTNNMAAFMKAIETGTPVLRREQTLSVLQILHAGNLSADEGRKVQIAEITGGAS